MADQGYPRSRAEAAAVFEAVEDSVAALTRSTTCAAWTRDRDDLLLVIEEPEGGAPGDFGALAQEVRAAVSRQHDLVPAEIVFVPARSIPRGGNDEVLRAETAAIHLRGGLDVLHATRQLGVAAPPLLGAEESIVDDEVLRGLADAAESGGEAAPLDLELMRLDVAELLGESAESIADDEDLIMRGLDSIMIMTLVNQWRADGVQVSFPELFQDAVLAKWWESISGTSEPAGDEAAVDEAVVDEAAPFDLSVMQHAYWVGRGDEQVLGGVGAHFYNEFSGRDVDPPRLERAVRALTERHGMLRARFTDDGRQWIAATCPWPGLSVHDLRQLAADEVDHRLSSLRERLSHRRWRSSGGGVRRPALPVAWRCQPGARQHRHAGRRRVELSHPAHRPGQVLRGTGGRAAAHRLQLPEVSGAAQPPRTQAAEQARAYWRDRIADLPGGPELPLAIAPERISQRRVTRRYHWLDAQGRDLLAAKARQHGLTMPVVFMTAFAEVLGTWSASKRFLLNLPLFDREAVHPDVFRLSGDFTNLILLEVDLTEPSSFAERARRLRAQLQSDTANAEYSGVAVLRDLARANGGEPVRAPVVFTSGLSLGELFSEEVRRCFGSPTWMISQGPQVWLDHQVTEHDGGLLLNWDAENELFPDGLLDAMFAAYRVVLDWLAAADWAQPVPPLLPAEQAAVRATVNETEGPTSGLLLHEGFFRTAEIAPQRPALLWGEQGVLSYGALADRARRIAGFLLGRGVRPGERVAITLPKGPDQVAAALGVLLAGATYVPVGVDQPVARRAKIYRRAEVRQVLTTAEERTDSTWPADVEPVAVEVATSVDPLTTQVPGDRTDLAAYVIFTSGSTGEPKGVMVSHAAAINTIADLNERFEVGAEDRVLAISALDFDLSVYDIFGLLSAGGALVLVPEAERRNAAHWVELARRWKVTIWQSVPALLDMLLTAAAAADQVLDLRLALLGGDWVTVDLLDRLRACSPKGRLVGLGGTTEAAIHSTICEVEEIPAQWSSVPYGTPLRNVRCRVVDERGQDCPDWGWGSCGSVAVVSRWATAATPTAPPNGSWCGTGSAGTAPVIWPGTGRTVRWSSWVAPTTRSRCGAIASTWVRSKPRSTATPTSPAVSWW
ncbi:AMP-binding protein [Saccharopolyspora spinosa]|uniref:AMP-binding protein n=1 Tax=Saccharopolyspora spinosa TaxID=60894 RepID=UPI00376F142D